MQSQDFHDLVVVITGASTGIGRAAALAFARRGAAVAVVGRRETVLNDLVQQCQGVGGQALAIPADVSDENAVKEAVRRVIEAHGRIDVWINNAAVTLFGPAEEVPSEAWRRVLEVNLFGYIHGARAVLPHFRERGSGTLINVSSVAGVIGQPYVAYYGASKFAINGLSQCLRMELEDAPDIHVCTLLAGSHDTPLFQHGGNYLGRQIQPIPPVESADKVVEKMLHLVRCPHAEVSVGGMRHLAGALHALAPRCVEKLAAQVTRKHHFREQAAEPTPGNLFEPMTLFSCVSGGWLQPEQEARRKMKRMALCAGVMLGLGILVWRAWRD
ncbi:MAG: SDR family NAD(P)-dependent oxidoreductase [Candidatus Zixiibacteriota bacterium]|nr:MAG: SDR family NAD(P)-dependent oxidoreductase [candidate division Zixibacteria bacterium]